MSWTRRRLLATVPLLIPTLMSSSAFAAGGTADQGNSWPRLLGAWRRGRENFVGTWSSSAGVREISLQFRAHDVVRDPNNAGMAVVVARRPGQYLARIDVERQAVVSGVRAEANRSFNGHAAFSATSRILYTSENDLISGDGLIGVRDADTFAKLDEFPSRGIGPHGLLIEPDGRLLIANGGILDIPKLDEPESSKLRNMNSSLVRLDAATGRCVDEWQLPDSRLSIRHLACSDRGIVGVALQSAHVEQQARYTAPVLAIFDGRALRMVAAPANGSLRGYAGDIAYVETAAGGVFALGCSHGGSIARWSVDAQWHGSTALNEACAVVRSGGSLIAITELGELARVASLTGVIEQAKRIEAEWDNHVSVWSDG